MAHAISAGCSEGMVLDLPVPSLAPLVQALRRIERTRMAEWATSFALATHDPKSLSKWLKGLLRRPGEAPPPARNDVAGLKRAMGLGSRKMSKKRGS